MKKSIIASICTLGLALGFYGNAGAATLLGTYTHKYGTEPGMTDPGGDDPLSADYVTVKDSSSPRFNDSFDFSGLSYGSLQKFELQLTYKDTSSSIFLVPVENWRLRLPGNPGKSSDDKYFSLTKSKDWVTTTFTLSNNESPFSFYETNEEFEFWFSENTWCKDEFKLQSATLKVYGDAAAVPLPAAAWLFGSALLGMVGVGYRRRSSE